MVLKRKLVQVVRGGAHAFNSGQRQVDLCEFEASLVYSKSFRTARATQRNPGGEKD